MLWGPPTQVSSKELMSALDRDEELCMIVTTGLLSSKGLQFLDAKKKAALWAVRHVWGLHGAWGAPG